MVEAIFLDDETGGVAAYTALVAAGQQLSRENPDGPGLAGDVRKRGIEAKLRRLSR